MHRFGLKADETPRSNVAIVDAPDAKESQLAVRTAIELKRDRIRTTN
jgi:hypothetical protein